MTNSLGSLIDRLKTLRTDAEKEVKLNAESLAENYWQGNADAFTVAINVASNGVSSEIPVKNALLDCLHAMENVLCDPEGIPCFQGSDGARQVIYDAMSKAWEVINNRTSPRVDAAQALSKAILEAHAKWAETYQGVSHVD